MIKSVGIKTLTFYAYRVVLFTLLLLFIGLGNVYGQFGMGNTLAPISGNNYPIIFANDAKGGHHQVATIAARNAIPALRRIQGMLCTVLDAGSGTPVTYQLIGGILDVNWVVFNSTATTSGSFLDLLDKPTTLAGYGISDGGTVTSASIVSANGVSGSVATPTTTPAISLTLGAITPSSIAASGNVTALRFLTTMPAAIEAASTTTVDLSAGNVFALNVTTNITTLILNNAPTQAATFVFKLSYSVDTPYNITWPAMFLWSGGMAPVLTCLSGKADIISVIFDGTNYYCSFGLNY
jgi:hypothetical protein